jgi:hypothetical protein
MPDRSPWNVPGAPPLAGGAALAVAVVLGCEGPDPVGAAALAVSGGYCLTDVHTDVPTLHFHGQEWLMDEAEGLGPRTLDVNITSFVQPQVVTNTTFKLDPGDVSSAVGYSVTDRFQVSASSSVSVPAGMYERLEAYTAFQRAIWEIRDAACLVHVGLGAAYKPVGVFFQTVDGASLPLPDPGIFVAAPDCEGPGCVLGAGLGQPAPAGGDGHPGDAGPPADGADAGPPPDGG